MSFQLDTYGEVDLTIAKGVPVEIAGGHRWSDLSRFTQGYIEALFAEVYRACHWATGDFGAPDDYSAKPAFSDLAPETLARIIADCEEYQRVHADLIGISRHPEGLPRLGRLFWIDRQNATVASFPPLAVQLGDDGKVRFTTPAQSQERRAGE